MKCILTFVFTLSVVLSGFSQSFVISDIPTLSDHLTYKNGVPNQINGKYYDYIDGSPFLKDDFEKGTIIINDSLRFDKVPLRYNILTDNIEFTDGKDQIMEIDNMQNYNVYIGDQHFKTSDYVSEDGIKHGVLEILGNGKIQLLKKYFIEFEAATKAIGYADAKPDRFVKKAPQYFIADGSNIPALLKTNKKALLKQLKQFKPNIEQYAKNKRLKPNIEKDLVLLIQYCNK